MQKKLFLTYFILIVFTLGVSAYLSWSQSYEFLSEQYNQQFLSQGRLLLDLIELEKFNDSNELQTFVNGYGDKIGPRITIIDSEGLVLADSEEDPTTMENHAYREEVKLALEGEIASSLRYSNTMGKYYAYTALPIESSHLEGVLRISLPVDAIEHLTLDMIGYIVSALILCSGIALGIAFFFTHMFMKPINLLTEAASDFANGNYNKKIYIKQKDQIGKLAETFNEMAIKLNMNMWKLTQRKTQLEAILSSMINGIVAIDGEYKIIFHNKIFADLLNAKGDIIGKSIYDVVRNPVLFHVLEASIETNEYIVEEGKLVIEDEKIIKVYANPIRLKKGKNTGTLLVIQDMTQIKKLENFRRDFVSNVTHELKTPLTSIRGFVDTLKSGAIQDETVARRFLDIIDIESERLYLLIQDILSLSEIESKQKEKNINEYKMEEIIEEVVTLLRPKVKESNIELYVNIESEIPLFKCNKDRIKQLMINLVDNAIKYTEQGTVTICCKAINDHLILEVEDTGIGIEQEHIPRLFERFYRVDRGRSRKQGGTGLGLSIVKHIVELYEGIIKVESQVGVGTKFIIKLPYKY